MVHWGQTTYEGKDMTAKTTAGVPIEPGPLPTGEVNRLTPEQVADISDDVRDYIDNHIARIFGEPSAQATEGQRRAYGVAFELACSAVVRQLRSDTL